LLDPQFVIMPEYPMASELPYKEHTDRDTGRETA
jgi:hypothetical protein